MPTGLLISGLVIYAIVASLIVVGAKNDPDYKLRRQRSVLGHICVGFVFMAKLNPNKRERRFFLALVAACLTVAAVPPVINIGTVVLLSVPLIESWVHATKYDAWRDAQLASPPPPPRLIEP